MKLIIITRSNYDAHIFCEHHNIDFESIYVVKSLTDLVKITDSKEYVVLPPGPRDFHTSIRIKLIEGRYINKTKFYIKKLLNY